MTTSKSPTETDHKQLSMFVLDVLRHDTAEQVTSILRLLNNRGTIGWRNFWPHDFSATEILPILKQLVVNGYVRVFRESSTTDGLEPIEQEQFDAKGDDSHLWFALTEEGRALWRQWEPPTVENKH